MVICYSQITNNFLFVIAKYVFLYFKNKKQKKQKNRSLWGSNPRLWVCETFTPTTKLAEVPSVNTSDIRNFINI